MESSAKSIKSAFCNPDSIFSYPIDQSFGAFTDTEDVQSENDQTLSRFESLLNSVFAEEAITCETAVKCKDSGGSYVPKEKLTKGRATIKVSDFLRPDWHKNIGQLRKKCIDQLTRPSQFTTTFLEEAKTPINKAKQTCRIGSTTRLSAEN